MIKMTRVYGDMYAPREYCTFTNPVTSGGTEEVDYVDMPCENGCEKECENCTLQKIMNEYASAYHPDEWQILQSVCMAGVKQCAVRAHIQQHND